MHAIAPISLPLVHSPFARPVPAEPTATPLDLASDSVTISEAAPQAQGLSTSSRVALAGLAALSLFGGIVATAHAAEPQQRPSVSATRTERVGRNDEVARQVRTYVDDMIGNNRVQSETLNTYQKALQNNYNTLVKIDARILSNPASLNDPTLRAIHEKAEAALDSMQVYEDTEEDRVYSAGRQKKIELADGTTITVPEESFKRVPRTVNDYSGSARMTDRAIEQIDKLLHPQGRPTP